MAKICVYVMTHDNGKAPRLKKGALTLKGCMRNNIEKNARKGDWIVGIGGKTLSGGQYDGKLIYAMKVDENKNNAPKSRTFYHFGNRAIKLEGDLCKFIRKDPKKRKGCNYFHDETHKSLFSAFDKFIKKIKKVGMIGSFIDPNQEPRDHCVVC